MSRNKKMSRLGVLLAFDAIVMIGAGVAINQYIKNEVREIEICKFNKGIAPNTIIKESDIYLDTVSAKGINEHAVRDKSEVVGMYTAEKVHKGESVDSREIAKKGREDALSKMNERDIAKLRKIAISVDLMSTWGGDIEKGDRVDLAFKGKIKSSSSGNEAEYTKAFMENVLVYDVLSSAGASYVKPENRPPIEIDPQNPQAAEVAKAEMAQRMDVKMVILAVTLDQYEEIATRMSVGKVSLIGRFEGSKSYGTSGFAINEIDEPLVLGPVKTEQKETIIIKD